MKDEIALQVQKDKASETCIEVLFLQKLCEDGKCQLAVEQTMLELLKLSGKVAKMKVIKLQIIIWVKGFGFTEYHTNQSLHSAVHSTEYLQDHLFYIITNMIEIGKKIIKPGVQALRKKQLPVL